MTNLAIVIAVIFIVSWLSRVIGHVVVLDYEQAIKYRRGSCVGVVGAGSYWFNPVVTRYVKFDLRPSTDTLYQEQTVTSDGVMVWFALDAIYQVVDPFAAMQTSASYRDTLRAELQNAFRRVIAAAPSAALIGGREELAGQIARALEPRARELGLKVIAVYLKDTDFPIRSKGRLHPGAPQPREHRGD